MDTSQEGSSTTAEPKEDPRHAEIDKLMREFYGDVDALFHFRVAPKAVRTLADLCCFFLSR